MYNLDVVIKASDETRDPIATTILEMIAVNPGKVIITKYNITQYAETRYEMEVTFTGYTEVLEKIKSEWDEVNREVGEDGDWVAETSAIYGEE